MVTTSGARSRARRRPTGNVLLWIAGAIAVAVLAAAAAAIVTAVASSSRDEPEEQPAAADPRAYERSLAEGVARRFYERVVQRRFEEAAGLASGAARDEQLRQEWARAQEGARDPDLASTIDHAMKATLISFEPGTLTVARDGSIELPARARIRREREHERTPWFRLRRNDQGVWLVEQFRP